MGIVALTARRNQYMKKILYVVLDGLGDLSVEELDNKTPLESALRPNMNSLTQGGKTGQLFPVSKDIAPESDIAVISLLGYNVEKFYTGRGPLECFAEGMKVNDGDLAFRVNFATLDKNGKKILDRRVGRDLTTEEAEALSREINSKIVLTDATFEFKNTIGHRGVLVIRSLKLKSSSQITNTDPAYERKGVFGVAKEKFENFLLECKPLIGYEKDPRAVEAARLTNEFTEKSTLILNESSLNKKRIKEGRLPANVILCRDAGDSLPKFPKIKEIFGLNFGCFAQMPVEKGISLLCGMDLIEVPPLTGHLDVDYSILAKITLEKIKDFDGLYIHIKGPDEPAHDGDFLKKKEIIELIDRFFFGNLIQKLNLDNTILAVTSDHSTPCSLKAHSSDPVPLLICGGGVSPDGSENFSEKACRNGSLGEILGKDLFPFLVKLAKE